jgi:pyridoxine 5-phosphate synthase
MKLVLSVKPHQVTLVPDAPDALTSNAGWDTLTHADFLSDTVDALHEAGIRSSIFVGTDLKLIEQAAKLGSDRVELYTEPYADLFPTDPATAIAPFIRTAQAARDAGLGLNAGHDLSLENLTYFTDMIPWVDEVSIGHALVCDALYLGFEKTIAEYKKCLIKK